jgi:hypothetical protein
VSFAALLVHPSRSSRPSLRIRPTTATASRVPARPTSRSCGHGAAEDGARDRAVDQAGAELSDHTIFLLPRRSRRARGSSTRTPTGRSPAAAGSRSRDRLVRVRLDAAPRGRLPPGRVDREPGGRLVNVVVVVPSRGRPDGARLTVEAIRETASASHARRPRRRRRRSRARRLPPMVACAARPVRAEVALVVLEDDETGDLVRATNTVSLRVAREDPALRHRQPRRRPRRADAGWDRMVLEALRRPGSPTATT